MPFCAGRRRGCTGCREHRSSDEASGACARMRCVVNEGTCGPRGVTNPQGPGGWAVRGGPAQEGGGGVPGPPRAPPPPPPPRVPPRSLADRLAVRPALPPDGTQREPPPDHQYRVARPRIRLPPDRQETRTPKVRRERPAIGNARPHQACLKQVEGSDRDSHLTLFWTQPLWLDLGEIRVVHACWHPDSISLLESALGGDRFRTVAQLARASDPGDELYTAVETILKGPEISLVDHGQPAYRDKDGIERKRARMRWWDPAAVTLRDLAEMGNFRATGGTCLLYTSPSPRDRTRSRMPSSA